MKDIREKLLNESKKGRKSFSVDTLWKISVALNIDPGLLFEIDMDELINQLKEFEFHIEHGEDYGIY